MPRREIIGLSPNCTRLVVFITSFGMKENKCYIWARDCRKLPLSERYEIELDGGFRYCSPWSILFTAGEMG